MHNYTHKFLLTSIGIFTLRSETSQNILLQPIAVLKERQVRSSSPHPAILRKVLTVQPLDPLVGEYGDVIGQGARVTPAAQLGVGEGS